MSSPSTFPSRFLAAALGAVAVVILIDQASELVVGLGSWDIGKPHWRFGAFGLAINRATIVVLADAIVVLVIAIRGSVGLLRVWAVVHLVMAAALAVTLAIFGLDVVEIKRTVAPAGVTAFLLQSARAAAMAMLLIGYCLWAGIGGVLAGRATRSKGQVGLVIPSGEA